MKRPMAIALPSMIVLVDLNFAFSGPSPRIEKIKGRVVAYSDGLTRLNGNAYWSMLIRVQDDATDAPAKFIQLPFSLPCKETPQWLHRKSPKQEFRLKRDPDADSVMKEFVDCAPDSTGECPHLPIWRLVPGAKDQKLPFGHVIPSYRSADLPLAPVV
jgi:hypothetical protein